MAEEKKVNSFLTNETEITLLKAAFSDNEDILKSIRALLLGFEISKGDANVIKSIFNDSNMVTAFQKKLYTILAADSMLGQGGDYWFGTDTEIIGRDPETIKQIVQSKLTVLTMLREGISLLQDPSGIQPAISADYVPDFQNDPFQIALLARNKYINAVNTTVMMVKVIAGKKDESASETMTRLKTDSAK